MRRATLLLVVGTLIAGCTARQGRFAGGRYFSRDLVYMVGELPDTWQRGDMPTADVAFDNADLGATIYVDNSCRRYADASLHVLANHLFFGFEDIDILEQEILEMDDREALRRVAEARLDGVLVKVGVTVVKKNTCIFDLVVISPKDNFDSAYFDYAGVVDGFFVEHCP